MPKNTRLYHCTNSVSLQMILACKYFKPFFCLEEYSFDTELHCAFAVVCFADLIEEELDSHMTQFNSDSYLVMSKDWANRMHLSPVIYYTKDSVIGHCFKVLVNSEIAQSRDSVIYNITNIMWAYYKQYCGHYYIKKNKAFSSEVVQFYNEREWRYIPLVQNYEAYYLEEHHYLNDDLRKSKEQELVDHDYVLRFEWSDIEEIRCPLSSKKKVIDAIHHSLCLDDNSISQKLFHYC